MTATESYDLDARYLADHGTVFLTGIQSLARLPLEQLRADRRAGWHTAAFVSGYPGSPLGGYDGAVAAAARLAADLPIVCRPALNEELAASAVMGTQLAALQPDRRYEGVVGIWYGKGPGVDRAGDALRHAVFAGTSARGGAVALVGDDPEAKSSTIPSSSAGSAADMHMPMLYPGDPAEALDLGRHAIALSRTTGLWVALKIVADVADATASVDLHPDRIAPDIPTVDGHPYRHQPDGRLLTPHTLELEQEIIEVRYELATRYASQNRLNRVTTDPSDAWLGIVSSGVTYREVREALGRLGLADTAAIESAGIRLLQMGMPFPFDPTTIRAFASGLDEVLVIEEKRPTIESLIKDTLYPLAERPLVIGKRDQHEAPLLPEHGALDADRVAPVLRSRLESRLGDRLAPPPPPPRTRLPLSAVRAPYYCSGCPHNRSTRAPDGALIGAGIGCHTMAMLMDPDRFGDIAGVTCMGSEGAQWIGMDPFVDRAHFIQNVGDGTYFHSAQLAVQAAVAAEVNITYKLLYNGAVAMTGGQQPQGQLPVPELVRVLIAQGVRRVLVTTDEPEQYRDVALDGGTEVWHRDRLFQAQEVLAATPGVTVLIHDQACAAELRRGRKRGRVPTPTQRVVINPRICEGCGDCGEVSNCLSVVPVETPFGRKTRIDQTTCNFDYSCLEGDCPSFMTIDTARRSRLSRWRRAEPSTVEQTERLVPGQPPPVPDPEIRVPTDDYAVRITGIGGTGVVTVAQVVGTAAMLDGFHVRGLDQTGLSQKAGPVVSDVRLSRTAPTATNRLGRAQADLLLAFDQLVAASEKSLLTCDPGRTAIVGSSSALPTGQMVTHLDVTMPGADVLAQRIGAEGRPDAQHWADAQQITTALFGQATTANLFVVGMAVQAGYLPISPTRIEEAIGLNGVAVEANTTAFRWGRAQIADPDAVRSACGPDQPVTADPPDLTERLAARIRGLDAPELQPHLELFAAELRAFQDEKLAGRWLDVLERTARAERRVAPVSSRLLAAVAANLYKLMAYKDEYEVARLMLDTDGMAEARRLAGPTGRIAWKLHPPMLRSLGMSEKLGVGSWGEPAIRALARAKRLRGTVADPFRWTEVRRVERALPGEYIDAIDRVLLRLDADNLDDAVTLAELPDLVRGYEEIKLDRVRDYRDRLAAASATFD